ncbi:UNVERIFIED_CONTAM: hypothetical protein GTU68_002915 [Idotea baltica]|nr:hypothetical protein [Idotea baltica]
MRTRKNPELSMEERDARHLLLKKWNQFKFEQHKQDLAMINRVLRAKEIALQELKEESEELYNEAIQLDLVLLPFRCKGPVSTPAIPGFVPVDGDYFDKTKNWD